MEDEPEAHSTLRMDQKLVSPATALWRMNQKLISAAIWRKNHMFISPAPSGWKTPGHSIADTTRNNGV